MSFTQTVRKMFRHRIGDRPTIHFSHTAPLPAGTGPGVEILTPIADRRPPTGTRQASVRCSMCGDPVRFDIDDAGTTRRRIALLRTATWALALAMVAFFVYMIDGMFFGPRDDRPAEILWLAVYGPLMISFLWVTGKFETADGVRLVEDDSHALETAPDGPPSPGAVRISTALLTAAGVVSIALGLAAVLHTVAHIDEVLCGEQVMRPGTRCAEADLLAEAGVGRTYEQVERRQIENLESMYNVAGVIAMVFGVGMVLVGAYRAQKASAPADTGSGGNAPTPAAPQDNRGSDTLVATTLTLAECGLGVVKPITVDTAVTCSRCRGVGRAAGAPGPCRQCGGDGLVNVSRTLQARIPPGVVPGHRIRLAGQGEQGRGGGLRGDLYLEVVQVPHPSFTRDGDALHTGCRIPRAHAARGGPLTVQTLIDGPVVVEVRPGTTDGTTVTMPGRGMPRVGTAHRGDLHIHIHMS